MKGTANMKTMLLIAAFLVSTSFTTAQDTTQLLPVFTWRIFLDTYYSYDFNEPENHLKPSFLYNHNRHNEVNVNLALIKASYATGKLRANIGFMAGTYVQYNLATEQEMVRHLYEANLGIKISKKNNLWIDAGIMPSHIGYESAISGDNWSLTRSIAAENSPYYEAGAKISYTSKNDRVLVSGMILNGWQRIQRRAANNTPSFGTQFTLKPHSNLTLNWSTFIGNDKPVSMRQWRYFNNVYGIFQVSGKLGLTLGFDIGLEQVSKGSSKLNSWYTPTIVVRYTPSTSWAIVARGEYYQDATGVIIPTGTRNGFQTYGASLNVDKKISAQFWWRTEIRKLRSKDAVFDFQNAEVKSLTAFTSSLTVTF